METFLQYLCDGTAGEWDVRVVAANDCGTTVHERVGRVRVTRAAALGVVASVSMSPTLPLHLWRERADCVVVHEPNPVAGTALLLRTPAPRLIVWHHSDLVRPWWAPHTYGRVQRALYRRADCVVVTNPVAAAQSPLVRCASRVAVIPLGVDLQRYRALTPAQRARVEQIRREMPGPLVLFVGRLVYYKGLDVLIRAMTDCPATLVIAGEGPLEGELRRLASALDLERRITFLGGVSDEDLPAYYRASDVFVLPSVAPTEAFGLVQVEAMASGVPVVSTNLPTGVPWVNQHDATGLTVPPRDEASLGAALRRLIDDPRLARAMGERGRKRAEAVFSRERTVESFKTLVETTVRTPELLDRRLAHAELV